MQRFLRQLKHLFRIFSAIAIAGGCYYGTAVWPETPHPDPTYQDVVQGACLFMLLAMSIALGYSAISPIYGAHFFLVYLFTRGRQDDVDSVVSVIQSAIFLIVFFAGFYFQLAARTDQAFNIPLDEWSAIYFSITTFATVGFGDIVPLSKWARISVSIEVLSGMFFSVFLFSILASYARDRSTRPNPG
jgi:Ion channel